MPKEPQVFLETEPWAVTERGFHPSSNQVAESIFSIGNEYMGVRGYFEEGYSGDRLMGSFFNGVYEREPLNYPKWFRGNPTHVTPVANSIDWLAMQIFCNGEKLDLHTSRHRDFVRTLDFRTGVLRRSFTWDCEGGAVVKITFKRMLCMERPQQAFQTVEFEAVTGAADLQLCFLLDANTIHTANNKCFWETEHLEAHADRAMLHACTINTRQSVVSTMHILGAPDGEAVTGDGYCGCRFNVRLKGGERRFFERRTCNYTEKDNSVEHGRIREAAKALAAETVKIDYETALLENRRYWAEVWKHSDIEIKGDAENQQGIRFCIFQLFQTYHGYDPSLNIGAKGLTGEVYWGGTWWDTETYCLPFYLFNNPQAAKHLLLWRHKILKGAMQRAKDHDCVGARYPMCTVDGTETCMEWQHGDFEIHVSAAVSYGIWHYYRLTQDSSFLYREGVEMLVEISRFYASRGSWSPITGEFGFWGVMGADEFHMMVHNNAYTNIMAKKSFEFTVESLEMIRKEAPDCWEELIRKTSLSDEEIASWDRMAQSMRTNFDPKTGLYEQHDGYFDLPHLDVSGLDPEAFPLYANWAYVNLFRYDMIKQPDVLLLMLFYSNEYTIEQKKVNYDYYEARCSHESSLSPGTHAILATELGYHEKAHQYSLHANRLDLDNYNRNTHEGLHTTSMAGAWLNVVYGWGGLRSDGELLSFNPVLPVGSQGYSFQIALKGSWIRISVEPGLATFSILEGPGQAVRIYGEKVTLGTEPVQIAVE